MSNEKEQGKGKSLEQAPGQKGGPGGPGPESLEDIPPEARHVVNMFGMATRFGPTPNPLLEKLTPAHIDRILDLSGKADEREFQDAQSSRMFSLIYIGIGAALLVFLTWFLVPIDKNVYLEIIKTLLAAGGGFGARVGAKTYWDRHRT